MPRSRKPTANDAHSEATRQRLLAAAGEIFALQGFRGATVRQICRRARANVASVNYHFGDKAGLYAEALKYAHTCASDKFPVDRGLPPDAAAVAKLEGFVRAFLQRQFDEGRTAWLTQMMQREMMEPTLALNALVAQQFRPQFDRLLAIVRDLLGKQVSHRQAQWAAMSVIGQCLFHTLARPVIERLTPEAKYTAKDVAELTAHITRFSLAALQHYHSEPSDSQRLTRGDPA